MATLLVHDVDQQNILMHFVISSIGLVGWHGPTRFGRFDATFMLSLPNVVVIAPSNDVELVHMVDIAV